MGGAPLTPICRARLSAPSMQLFGKKKKEEPPASVPKKRGGGGFFYDDEIDTVTQAPWEPTYAEHGEVDLANVGGVYYLAFIPFLLLFIAYSTYSNMIFMHVHARCVRAACVTFAR